MDRQPLDPPSRCPFRLFEVQEMPRVWPAFHHPAGPEQSLRHRRREGVGADAAVANAAEAEGRDLARRGVALRAALSAARGWAASKDVR